MGKNAYLIVSDTHFGNISAKTRKDYRAEISHVECEMLKAAKALKDDGFRVVTLFLGDIFHNSYTDVTSALLDKDFIALWRSGIGECLTVMGNHEFTYYRANPFYTAVSEIEADSVRAITNKVWMPLGMTGIIRVVDALEDGEVVFHFNHYGTAAKCPVPGKVNIGLFHQQILDEQIREQCSRRFSTEVYGTTMDVEGLGILNGYDVCMFGHMHKVYGVWESNGTYLYYLASLGRTNETEVQDSFLERNLPAVLVEDGQYAGVRDYKFDLLDRSTCIYENVVDQNREVYLKNKEIREIREYVPLGDDPIANLRQYFREDAGIAALLEDMLVLDRDMRRQALEKKMEELGIDYK